MMKTTLIAASIFITITLTGCYITGMELENQTGKTIQVYSDHTKTTTVIGNGKTKEFPHSTGLVTISTTNGLVWNYPTFSWFSEDQAESRYLKRHPILYKGTRGFLVDTNGSVFALMPAFVGWKHKTSG
jgi:hypothetical protein